MLMRNCLTGGVHSTAPLTPQFCRCNRESNGLVLEVGRICVRPAKSEVRNDEYRAALMCVRFCSSRFATRPVSLQSEPIIFMLITFRPGM